MLISLILIILPATPFPLSIPAFHTAPIPARHSPYPPAFHTTPIPARHSPYPPAFHTTPIPARHSPYPSIPHRSYSRTPFPLSQHSTPLLFPHAIPLIPAFHTTPIPARPSPYPSIPHCSYSRTSPYPPAFHTTPVPARQTPLTARSQILSKHLRIPCLTAIPYLFAMASMASGQREGIPFIIYRLFCYLCVWNGNCGYRPGHFNFIDYGKDSF